jgi:hypothetical protein
MEEAADVIELLDSRLPSLDLQRNGALNACETVALSAKADCPAPDNAARQDILTEQQRVAVEMAVETADRSAAYYAGQDAGRAETASVQAATLRELLERVSLQSESPAIGEKPTLTAEEREAVSYYLGTGGPDGVDATLIALLERMA